MIVIYTDGSARRKSDQWIGAYAYELYCGGKAIYQKSMNLIPATINLCELMAVINALYTCNQLYPNQAIQIYTDSQYVAGGFKHPLQMKTNQTSWQALFQLTLNRPVEIFHVKSHHTDYRNNHVDRLARAKLRSQFA